MQAGEIDQLKRYNIRVNIKKRQMEEINKKTYIIFLCINLTGTPMPIIIFIYSCMRNVVVAFFCQS